MNTAEFLDGTYKIVGHSDGRFIVQDKVTNQQYIIDFKGVVSLMAKLVCQYNDSCAIKFIQSINPVEAGPKVFNMMEE